MRTNPTSSFEKDHINTFPLGTKRRIHDLWGNVFKSTRSSQIFEKTNGAVEAWLTTVSKINPSIRCCSVRHDLEIKYDWSCLSKFGSEISKWMNSTGRDESGSLSSGFSCSCSSSSSKVVRKLVWAISSASWSVSTPSVNLFKISDSNIWLRDKWKWRNLRWTEEMTSDWEDPTTATEIENRSRVNILIWRMCCKEHPRSKMCWGDLDFFKTCVSKQS